VNVGDRITIISIVWLGCPRSNIKGTISNIDGEYILVVPDGYEHEIELYRNEIQLIKS
jgi:hypothetical protein